jgi:hypothetical protein
MPENSTVLCRTDNVEPMSSIRPTELDDRLDSPSGARQFLLDIRPAASFEAGAIDGSHNVPVYDELRQGDASALLGGMSGWHGYQNGSLSYKLRSLVWRPR